MTEGQATTARIGAFLLAAVALCPGCARPEGARLDGGAGAAGPGPAGREAGAIGGAAAGMSAANSGAGGGQPPAASCPGSLAGAAAGSTGSDLVAPPSTAPAATVTYVADTTAVLANPERGFHSRYEIIDDPKLNPYLVQGNTGGNADRTFAAADMALGGKNVIIHSYVHLDPWIASAHIDGALMTNLAAGLAAVRAHKKKIVLRFAYTWASDPSASTEATIMSHIDDLAPVINANADVILHLEAGMLGEWGEWHDGPMADWNTQASFDSKYRIVKKMLQTWDAGLPILIRYPLDSHEILTRTTPPPSCALANGCLLTQAEKDRIGFHDDCVLADPADQGTYDIGSSVVQPYTPAAGQRGWVQDSDPAFRASYGGSKMVGGESCDSAGDDPADCSNALATWKAFQWTEINEDYAPVNTSIWQAAQLPASGDDPAETCWMRMKRKLGYRLRMVDATFPRTITLGQSHAFSAHLFNDGWASPVKARPAFLVIDKPGGADRFVVPLTDVDVRRWKSGAAAIADERFVPTGLPPGSGYRLSLWLPDPAQGLAADPSYAIELANKGTWDASTGLNVLATDLTVVASTGAGNGSGSSRAAAIPGDCSPVQDGGAGGAPGAGAAGSDGGPAVGATDAGGSAGTSSAAGAGGSAGSTVAGAGGRGGAGGSAGASGGTDAGAPTGASLTVTLSETPEAFRNPMKGFRPSRYIPDAAFPDGEYVSTYKHYIPYSTLETSASDGVQKIRDWSDANWSGLRAHNQKVIPRVLIVYPGTGEYWGDIQHDGTPAEWTTDTLKARLVAFAAKLGQAWDDDPRVAAVEMGLWGKWGEQNIYPDQVEGSDRIPADFQQALGDAFNAAFKNKKVMIRYPNTFANDTNVGFYWDSFALPDDDNAGGGAGIVARDVWRTQMLSGEVAYDWGDQSHLGGSPAGTLSSTANTDYVIGYIQKLHASSLGWIAQYTPDGGAISANAARMQKAFGYRFVIKRATFDSVGSSGGAMGITVAVANVGNAPFYYSWPVEVSLLDASRSVVWRGTFTDVDVTKWVPGNTYILQGSFTPSVPAGTYTLALAVLDPASSAPSLRFANTNYYHGGRTPLGRVGFGTSPTDQDLGSFDGLKADTSLSY